MTSSQVLRQSLRLHIDPRGMDFSPDPSSSPYSAGHKNGWSYESPNGDSYERICTVLCLYDFESSDRDHLPFHKNEILEIVREEESGWWAAIRNDGAEVGWIPASYVRVLPEDVAKRVRSVREETRIPMFSARTLARSAPSSFNRLKGSPLTSSIEFSSVEDDSDLDTGKVSAFEFYATLRSPNSRTTKELPRHPVNPTDIDIADSPIHPRSRPLDIMSPALISPPTLLAPPKNTLRLDKSLPASPAPVSPLPTSASAEALTHSRSVSSPATVTSPNRRHRRRPLLLDDRSSLQRLSLLMQAYDMQELESLASPEALSPLDPVIPRSVQPRVGKIKQLTGDDDAQALYNAKLAQANLPWYLRPKHGDDEIKLDRDGNVQAGTLSALVEKLVSDPLKMSAQESFRHAFLITFHTFATATQVFDLLVAHYETSDPQGLSETEFEEWKRERLRPTQKRVLSVLTMWLEEHDILNQDPEIASRLREFLSLISSPATLALSAKHMLISLERRMAGTSSFTPSSDSPPSKRRKSKTRKYDQYELLRLDPLDLAFHLAVYEHGLYSKIHVQECLRYTQTQKGPAVKNMETFCGTSDKLANWVKLSIIENEGLNKRANTIDFWIRVAEKCRSLHNYASMSAIVAALSSAVLSRLHFTWLHSSREAHLDPLVKYNAPAGNYSFYRAELDTVEGPCVPFLGMYLKTMIYIADQHTNTNTITVSAPGGAQKALINFVQRQKWYDVSTAMLRFQSKPYSFEENPLTTAFIRQQLAVAAAKDEQFFWDRSEELQQAEMFHADIRKGLEAAGF